jgi:adenylate cyclase
LNTKPETDNSSSGKALSKRFRLKVSGQFARYLGIFAACFSGLAMIFFLRYTGLLERIDHGLYDGSAKLYAAKNLGKADPANTLLNRGTEAPSQVELVFIDQYSLTWVEKNLGLSWPWPRELYGIMAGYMSEARAQAFDILFTEVSSYGPEDDARCAAAMDEAGNVVLAEARERETGMRLSPVPVKNASFGSVRGLVDSDGILRRYRAEIHEFGGRYPSLGLAALQRAGSFREGSLVSSEVYLRFRGSSPSLPARNAAEIISAAIAGTSSGKLTKDYFRDKFIFIGFSAPGLLDRQAVPTDSAMPGVEIHASFAADYLDGNVMKVLPGFVQFLLAALFIVGAACISMYSSKPMILLASTAILTVFPFLLEFLLYRFAWVATMGAGLAGGMTAFSVGIIISYVLEGKTRIFLKKSFSQYLSPHVIDELVKNPSALTLGGEERTITAFFSDIQGFTSLSEGMEPIRLAAFMNKYFSVITDIILEEGGTVDKYVGDAVVAFWNAPLEMPDHAVRAVRAALRCQSALEASELTFASIGAPVPATRIGLHTGKAVVGNMGSSARFNYTAMGDVMNTASRLEHANKAVGTRILVSDSMASACRDQKGLEYFSLHYLGRVSVAGKKMPVEVWEPRAFEVKNPSVDPWNGVLQS